MRRVELVLGLLQELQLRPDEIMTICESLGQTLPDKVTISFTAIRWQSLPTRAKNVLQYADIGSDELLSMLTTEWFGGKDTVRADVTRYLEQRNRRLRRATETVAERAQEVFGGLHNLPVEYLFIDGNGDSIRLQALGCRTLGDIRKTPRLREELADWEYNLVVKKLHKIGFEL